MDRKSLVLIVLLPAFAATGEEASPRVPLDVARANAKGNEKVGEGLFEEAADLYRSEALKLPENGILQRNLAGALARAGLGEEALASYSQALRFAEGREEQAKVYYDLANTLTLAGQFEPAMEQYTRALLLNPADMDTKHNMEFLQRMMQEQEQQQEQQDQDQEQEQEQQDQQQEQEQDQQQQQDQQQGQEQQQEEQQQDQQQEQQAPEQEQPMSEEDAQRLLDAMMEEEQEFQEMRVQQQVEEKKNVEKDW